MLWRLVRVGDTVTCVGTRGRIFVTGALLVVAACAPQRPLSGEWPTTPCPETAGTPVERVCRDDVSVETLQARFRATVVVDGDVSVSDGVLLVRRPDAVRVKLFGFGGMTVHDATWVGDGTAVRGFIRRPLSGEPIALMLRSGESVPEPEAELSLALWSLWRPRCRTAPTGLAAEPGWLRLDPDTAQALARDVRVGPLGVDEERLVRGGDGTPDVIEVRYLDRDCALKALLPTRIEIASQARGWRATVDILAQEQNLPLDDRLFDVPASAEAGR